MSEKRRALGRGLGALIPNQTTPGASRPADIFFRDSPTAGVALATDESAARATSPLGVPQGEGVADAVTAEGPSSADRSLTSNDTPSAPSAGDVDTSSTEASGALAPVPGATFADLPLTSIRPNPKQPRSVFDEDDMAELVHSITEIGVLQPVVVRTIPGGPVDGATYELIMGERRWRASGEAGKETVPAIIKDTEDDDLLRDALLENLHRSQLNALEEAAAYQQLLDDFSCTQEELARRIGRSRPQISNTLRLLRLPPLVARRVAAGVLSAGHARALLSLEDGAAQERLAQRIVAEGLSVRSVEEIVAMGVAPEKARRAAPRPGGRHPQLDDVAMRISDHLETRAKISLGQRKGKMTIEFASVEDLHRILGAMGVSVAEDELAPSDD
ncbi:ParB/RepB/Spo0J family partition protein [Janibacter sp. G1551]|uniref:ParB/RepB/Spo0J family partition protein n=1 Tax=Janibacter sp. G1551 TaxID=3420440 RepID=UPI003D01C241